MRNPWDGLATGVEAIDTEHRLQVSLVDALDALVRKGDDPALAEKTLGQLVDFTNVHFLSEELMMRLYSYPQHDAHKLEHARLVDEVDALRRQMVEGDAQPALETIGRLRPWLAGHIRSMDQAFTRWCEKNGIHPQ